MLSVAYHNLHLTEILILQLFKVTTILKLFTIFIITNLFIISNT